jgi:hypothetical protein
MQALTHNLKPNYILKQTEPSKTNTLRLFWQQTPQPNNHPVGTAPTPKPYFKQYFTVNI